MSIGFERKPDDFEGPTKVQRLSLEPGAVKAPLDPVKEPAPDTLEHPKDSNFILRLDQQTTFSRSQTRLGLLRNGGFSRRGAFLKSLTT